MSLRNIIISSLIGLGSLSTGIYAVTEYKPKLSVYELTDTNTGKSVELRLYGDRLPPLLPNTKTTLKLLYPAEIPWLLNVLAVGGIIGTVGILSLGIAKDNNDYPDWLAQQQIRARAIRNNLEKDALKANLQQEHEKVVITDSAPQLTEVQLLQQEALMGQLKTTQEIEQVELDIKLAKLKRQAAKLGVNSTNNQASLLPAHQESVVSEDSSPKKSQSV